jgi:agmatinase
MPIEGHPRAGFLNLPPELSRRESAGVLILPVPYEATTSYVRGTEAGPAAIIAASAQVEWYDEIGGDEPCRSGGGIHTLPPPDLPDSPPDAVAAIAAATSSLAREQRFVLALGGEHALTVGAVAGVAESFPSLTVVQIDAHADLRNSYRGSTLSHGCVMRRLAEKHPLVAVGIRSFSAEEAGFRGEHPVPTVFAYEIAAGRGSEGRPAWIDQAIGAIPTHDVYLTVDLDGLDPSVVPAVGTPEPGGILWHEALDFLSALFSRKRVLAADVVELCPVPGFIRSDFAAARLVYKIAGHALRERRVP